MTLMFTSHTEHYQWYSANTEKSIKIRAATPKTLGHSYTVCQARNTRPTGHFNYNQRLHIHALHPPNVTKTQRVCKSERTLKTTKCSNTQNSAHHRCNKNAGTPASHRLRENVFRLWFSIANKFSYRGMICTSLEAKRIYSLKYVIYKHTISNFKAWYHKRLTKTSVYIALFVQLRNSRVFVLTSNAKIGCAIKGTNLSDSSSL